MATLTDLVQRDAEEPGSGHGEERASRAPVEQDGLDGALAPVHPVHATLIVVDGQTERVHDVVLGDEERTRVRQTDRQTDRQIERQTDRQIERQTDRQ